MNSEERTIVNVKDENGDVEEIEIISQISSTRDDKEYIIYTTDKQIEDEVNINVGLSVSKLVQQLKGKTSRTLQMEFKELRKRYWGRHLWASGYFCRSVGTVTRNIIKEYIENQEDEYDENFKIVE